MLPHVVCTMFFGPEGQGHLSSAQKSALLYIRLAGARSPARAIVKWLRFSAVVLLIFCLDLIPMSGFQTEIAVIFEAVGFP